LFELDFSILGWYFELLMIDIFQKTIQVPVADLYVEKQNMYSVMLKILSTKEGLDRSILLDQALVVTPRHLEPLI
jgi:hypothetical protein